MPTLFLVGNVTTVLRETLLNASVQDHRWSNVIFSNLCSKAGSVTCPSSDRFLSKLFWEMMSTQNIYPCHYEKFQTKFWGCHLKVLLLADQSWTGRKKLLTSSLQQSFIFLKTLLWFAKTAIIPSAPRSVHLPCNLLLRSTKHSSNQSWVKQTGFALCLAVRHIS